MTIEEYFGTLQQSFVEVWKDHLETSKYSSHKVLNEFYDEIVDKVDKLIEDYMGIYGKVSDFKNTITTKADSPVDYLKELKKFTKTGRNELIKEDDTELWSDIDDILGCIDSTLYKLNELKESKSLSDFIKESLITEKGWGDIEDFYDGDDIESYEGYIDYSECDFTLELKDGNIMYAKMTTHPMRGTLEVNYREIFDNYHDFSAFLEDYGENWIAVAFNKYGK